MFRTLVSYWNASTATCLSVWIQLILSQIPVHQMYCKPWPRAVVIHAGTNDLRQSEILKNDFKSLMCWLQMHGGYNLWPFTRLHKGKLKFSHLLSVNNWLGDMCKSKDISFINNFQDFWEHPGWYKSLLSPNKRGSYTLSKNNEKCNSACE